LEDNITNSVKCRLITSAIHLTIDQMHTGTWRQRIKNYAT